MQTRSKALLFAVALAPALLAGLGTTPALAQYPPGVSAVTTPPAPPVVAYAPAPIVPPRPVAVASVNTAPSPVPAAAPAPAPAQATAQPSGYWGQPAPPKKPNAIVRFFHRIGGWMDGEEGNSAPVYRDPTTGRTNRVGTEPWLKMLDK